MRISWWVLGGVLSVVLMAGGVLPAEETAKQENKPSEVVLGEKEAPELSLVPVKTEAGVLLGWRVELVNISKDKDLMLVIRGETGTNYSFEMTDKQGESVNVGFTQEQLQRVCPPNFRHFRLVRVQPGTGHCWFLAAPSLKLEVNVNDGILYKNVSFPKGHYKVAVTFQAGYFAQNEGDEVIPKYPEYPTYRTMEIKSEVMEVEIDPEVQKKEDLVGTYLKQRAVKATQKKI